MNLRNLFSRKPQTKELAPQIGIWDRRTYERPGPPDRLPYPTYDQMEQDSMIQTALTLKKLGVLASAWRLEPAEDEPYAARHLAFTERNFAQMEGSPEDILRQAMDAFAKGWSVQEMVFEEAGGEHRLRAVRPKDPAMFGLNLDDFGRLRSLRLELPGQAPRDLPRDHFVVYTHRGGYGRPKGKSDLDAAYPHWRAKADLAEAWSLHLQKFASPTMLGRFARGVTSAEQSAILDALNRLDRNTAITFPNDIEVSALGGSPTASTGYMDAIDFHNREIARAILGQTLTTDEGRRVGSLALGRVHLQVLLLQLVAIRRELADRVMTEQVVRPLIERNFGPVSPPRFRFEDATATAFARGELS